MTCNLTSTPFLPEPLPLYVPRGRDPETSSIISSAPSYTSEAPTYVSHRQSLLLTNQPANTNTSIQSSSSLLPPRAPNQSTTGLPPIAYAEGFQSRAYKGVGDLSSHKFAICSWSSLHSSQNARQYQNVAARRARASASPLFSALVSTAPPEASEAIATSSSSSSAVPATPSTSTTPPTPSAFPATIEFASLSPHEDPYLVGESAAAAAKASRIYREMCLRNEEAVKHEGQSWDFLLAQMVDWEERERSWARFRNEVGWRKKGLQRRMFKF